MAYLIEPHLAFTTYSKVGFFFTIFTLQHGGVADMEVCLSTPPPRKGPVEGWAVGQQTASCQLL